MSEPRRLLDSRPGHGRQLMLAALAEVPSDAAWRRAAARLGQAGLVIGTTTSVVTPTSIAMATVSSPSSAAKSGLVSSVAATASLKAPWIAGAVFAKALLLGLGIGGVVVLGARYAPRSVIAPPQAPVQAAVSARPVIEQPNGAVEHQSRLNRSELDVPKARQMVKGLRAAPSKVPIPIDKGSEAEPHQAYPTTAEPLPRPEIADRTTTTLQRPSVVAVSDNPRLLEREVTAIAKARQALLRTDAATAIRELESVEGTVGFRVLSQEAGLLRVEALAMSGQTQAAATLARRLLVLGVAESHRSRLLELATLKK
ncbi:MAG TPA: hypothetical protein VIV60_20610 [Polyangiaceae bacterium]